MATIAIDPEILRQRAILGTSVYYTGRQVGKLLRYYIVDEIEFIPFIDTRELAPGSKCFCLEDCETYILTGGRKQWVILGSGSSFPEEPESIKDAEVAVQNTPVVMSTDVPAWWDDSFSDEERKLLAKEHSKVLYSGQQVGKIIRTYAIEHRLILPYLDTAGIGAGSIAYNYSTGATFMLSNQNGWIRLQSKPM